MTEPSIEQLKDVIETFVSRARSGTGDTGEATGEQTSTGEANQT